MIDLSKSRILAHRQCPKRLWLQSHRPELAQESAPQHARLAAGNDVGEVARALHPGGILIDTLDSAQALADTRRALAQSKRPLFEAAFERSGVLVRADLLLPQRGGYRLVEVKSATSVKDYHLQDAAVQTWVAERAGITLRHIEIAHIDSGFVYPGGDDYRGLFAHADISGEARALAKEVPAWVRAARATLQADEPDIEPGAQCHDPFDCPFLGYCVAQDDAEGYPPEILPHSAGKTLAEALRAEGYTDLRKVPASRIGSSKFARIWRVTRSGKAELDPAAAEAIAALGHPRHYLDFETIQFAVPIWAGTRPYQQIPFQWSCHTEKRSGAIEHREFLAHGKDDPRRELAESLIDAVGAKGAIVAYNAGFERGRVEELAATYGALAPALTAVAKRIVDLLPIARAHYYHREMRGSWSLKALLPTIAPELDYEELAVHDGGMAQETYAQMLDPATPAERIDALRADLLAYCERDTWAMLRVAHHFEGR